MGIYGRCLLFFPLYIISSRRPVVSAGRETGRSGRSTFSPAAAKAHLSSIHTNQVLHKTLAQTSLCRQIASASNAPSALLPLLCFFVLFFQFACLPASCLPSFSSDFVYCDFWPPFFFFATSSFTLSTKQVIKSASKSASKPVSKQASQ